MFAVMVSQVLVLQLPDSNISRHKVLTTAKCLHVKGPVSFLENRHDSSQQLEQKWCWNKTTLGLNFIDKNHLKSFEEMIFFA